MRTIEAPRGKEERVYRVRCAFKDCQALLEVARDELSLRQTTKFERVYTLKCPHCLGLTAVDSEDLKRMRVYPIG